jgi:hypothetical protein
MTIFIGHRQLNNAYFYLPTTIHRYTFLFMKPFVYTPTTSYYLLFLKTKWKSGSISCPELNPVLAIIIGNFNWTRENSNLQPTMIVYAVYAVFRVLSANPHFKRY